MFVFMEDAAESFASSDVEVDLLRIDGWNRQRVERAGVALTRADEVLGRGSA
jgi:hypothetical protein